MAASTGTFVWYELMTNDPKAATAFYADVVGWQAQDAGMPEPYTLLNAGDVHVAGLMQLPAEAAAHGTPPCWMGYVSVDDVDAGCARLQAAGGTVHRPAQDIPGVGRFAVVADPHGAAFMLFRDAGTGEAPAHAPGTPGTVGWHELHAGHGEQAFAFYAAQFGWEKDTAIDMGPMGTYQLFRTGGPEASGGMMTKMPEQPVPAWLFYFNVPAIDAAAERVARGGGKVVNGPMQVPGGGWIVNAIDPQGAMFALVAPQR